ncbi:unnamed protein product [Staurois parvus]|uniref:Uncharacterized protein n=1 Tax=Staurois parvus TaxID=386267 RepID=A0ABN9DFW0_9NEOB|nr:unnamed protein product [Staurois parvus]
MQPRSDRQCAVSGSPIHGKSRICRLGRVISCVQSQLITSPAAPPVSVHQCQLSMLIHATCQCPSVPHQCHILVPISATSMPHISAHLSCLSVSPISACQCHLSMPVSATYQCCQ